MNDEITARPVSLRTRLEQNSVSLDEFESRQRILGTSLETVFERMDIHTQNKAEESRDDFIKTEKEQLKDQDKESLVDIYAGIEIKRLSRQELKKYSDFDNEQLGSELEKLISDRYKQELISGGRTANNAAKIAKTQTEHEVDKISLKINKKSYLYSDKEIEEMLQGDLEVKILQELEEKMTPELKTDIEKMKNTDIISKIAEYNAEVDIVALAMQLRKPVYNFLAQQCTNSEFDLGEAKQAVIEYLLSKEFLSEEDCEELGLKIPKKVD